MTNPSPSAGVEKRDIIHLADFWPCGHSRTAENTANVGKAGVRCKACRKARRALTKGATHG